jgi:hypothetical protein
MTDKVQKIKDWISKEQDGLMDAQDNFEYPEHEGAYHILCNLDAYIDSLQEEPVSEGLDDAAFDYAESCKYDGGEKLLCVEHFKAGSEWQKEQMMAKAIDAHCFGFQDAAALFTFRLPAGSYLVGSEVKVIVIK